MFANYCSTQGHALIDRQLLLLEDSEQREEARGAAGVPERVGACTKLELGFEIVQMAARNGRNETGILAAIPAEPPTSAARFSPNLPCRIGMLERLVANMTFNNGGRAISKLVAESIITFWLFARIYG